MKALFDSLSEVAKNLLGLAMSGATVNFIANGSLMPVILFERQGNVGIMGIPSMPDSEARDQVAAMISNLRRDCGAVVFLTEAWTLHNGSEADTEYAVQRGLSTHPNRGEAIIVNLYVPGRVVTVQSIITREPTKVHDWEVLSDSASDNVKPVGRFVDVLAGSGRSEPAFSPSVSAKGLRADDLVARTAAFVV